jgi:hypothetical protein
MEAIITIIAVIFLTAIAVIFKKTKGSRNATQNNF